MDFSITMVIPKFLLSLCRPRKTVGYNMGFYDNTSMFESCCQQCMSCQLFCWFLDDFAFPNFILSIIFISQHNPVPLWHVICHSFILNITWLMVNEITTETWQTVIYLMTIWMLRYINKLFSNEHSLRKLRF